LIGALACISFLKTVAVFVVLVAGDDADGSGIVYFQKNILPDGPGVVAPRFLLRSYSCFA
jgi:hypothetical protein